MNLITIGTTDQITMLLVTSIGASMHLIMTDTKHQAISIGVSMYPIMTETKYRTITMYHITIHTNQITSKGVLMDLITDTTDQTISLGVSMYPIMTHTKYQTIMIQIISIGVIVNLIMTHTKDQIIHIIMSINKPSTSHQEKKELQKIPNIRNLFPLMKG